MDIEGVIDVLTSYINTHCNRVIKGVCYRLIKTVEQPVIIISPPRENTFNIDIMSIQKSIKELNDNVKSKDVIIFEDDVLSLLPYKYNLYYIPSEDYYYVCNPYGFNITTV